MLYSEVCVSVRCVCHACVCVCVCHGRGGTGKEKIILLLNHTTSLKWIIIIVLSLSVINRKLSPLQKTKKNEDTRTLKDLFGKKKEKHFLHYCCQVSAVCQINIISNKPTRDQSFSLAFCMSYYKTFVNISTHLATKFHGGWGGTKINK